MAERDRITTPMMHRWRRFRYSVLPAIAFTGLAALTLFLWDYRGQVANAVGEVEAVRLDVSTAIDGTLVPLVEGPHQWTLFDSITKGQVLARLDPEPANQELETLRRELVQIEKELGAAEEQYAFSKVGIKQEHFWDKVRAYWQYERRELLIANMKVDIEAARIELLRYKARVGYLKPLVGSGAIAEAQLVEEQLLARETERRIEELEATLRQTVIQQDRAAQVVQRYPDPEFPDLLKITAPIVAKLDVQESRIQELRIRIRGLEVRSPIEGTIAAVYTWPNQNVTAGEPILTVAADHGRYIVSYVRQDQGIRPELNTAVQVRLRIPGAEAVAAKVERVGPQFEAIPLSHLREPNTPEWGLPVRISLPKGLDVRPGEMVDITFTSSNS